MAPSLIYMYMYVEWTTAFHERTSQELEMEIEEIEIPAMCQGTVHVCMYYMYMYVHVVDKC